MNTIAVTLPLLDFEVSIEIVVLGVITGVAYALFGLGLTLTYQNSRVINFAQGAMGALPHLLLASLVIDHNITYWVALPVALVVGLAAGAGLQALVVRRLARAPRLVVLVATIGAAQVIAAPTAAMVNLSESGMAQAPYPTPFDLQWSVGSLQLQSGHVLMLVLAPVFVLALTWFMRGTTVGVASRAIAENEEAAQLSGIPVHRVSLAIWAIAGLLAASAAILAGPTRPILELGGGGGFVTGGDLLLRGLGAAMIGGLVSLPQVFLAGLGLGLIESLVLWNYPAGNLVNLVMMIIIVGSLLLRSDLRRAARGAEGSSWSLAGALRELPEQVRVHPRVKLARRVGLGALLLVAFLLPIGSPPSRVVLFSSIALLALVGLSLVILTGWGGQVSLGHFAFVGIGALVGGRLHQLGYQRIGVLVGVVVIGAIAAAVVGLPALRIRGLFLAVTTLAFAVVVDSWLTGQSWLVSTTFTSSSTYIPRPSWGGIDFQPERNYYWLSLSLLVLTGFLIHQLRQTGLARSIMAVRDNEPMAASLSISPTTAKLSTFMLSGALASFGGYFYAGLLTDFRSAGITSPTMSLDVVVMAIFGGVTSITGIVIGALYIRGIPYFIDAGWAQLLSSGMGLLVVLLFLPSGLASFAFRLRDLATKRLAPEAWAALDDDVSPTARTEAPRLAVTGRGGPRLPSLPGAPPAIEVAGIVKHYDGVTAIDDVSLQVAPGEVVGLIGPNGAGKTTLIDVLSGHVQPDAGSVHLEGIDMTALPPEHRASLGLARSFQQASLFGDLTVIDVLKVALEHEERSEMVPSLLGLPPSREAESHKDLRAHELIDMLGLGRFAHKHAAELSTGSRRVVELGCVIALGARMLLLDEPTGGIAQREVEAFTPLLRQIHDHLGATTLIVAHDIPMIRQLTDRVFVMAAGRLIAQGPPDEVMEDPLVIASYLGAGHTAATETAASSTVLERT